MSRIGHYIRVGAAMCLVVVCLRTAWWSAKLVYNSVVHALTGLDVLLGVAMALTWVLLLVASIGLLRRKRWAFWLLYVAALLNLAPGYIFVPFVGLISPLLDPTVSVYILFYGVNAAFVMLLVFAHVVTRWRLESAV